MENKDAFIELQPDVAPDPETVSAVELPSAESTGPADNTAAIALTDTADDIVLTPAQTPVSKAEPEVPAVTAPPAADIYAAPTYASSDVQTKAAAGTVKEKKPRKKGAWWKITLSVAGALIVLMAASVFGLYFTAQGMYNDGEYDSAKMVLSYLDFIPAFRSMAMECDYADAEQLANNGQYLLAHMIYENIIDYKDSAEKADQTLFEYGKQLLENENYEKALETFEELGDYEGAAEMVLQTKYLNAESLLQEGRFAAAKKIFEELGDYEDAASRVVECDILYGVKLYRSGQYNSAMELLNEYYKVSDLARAYCHLCLFRQYEEEGASIEMIGALYTMIEEYSYMGGDVEEALEHPFFFVIRFFGAGWKYEGYALDADPRSLTIYHSYLPWYTPNGDLWYFWDDDGLFFCTDDAFWFGITGFDSYDTRHPENMYIVDSEGNQYTFYNYFEYDV